MLSVSFVLLSFLANFASAKLLTDPAGLSKAGYDFVIVGGGTAGSVLANRLSANPKNAVLVLEAGGNDADIELLQIPYLAPNNLANASLIWDYTTVNQTGLDNRPLGYQRGRVLGGSSSINFLFYTRGSADDYDRFASFSGDKGWSWDSIFPYILKSETFVQPVEPLSSSGQVILADHGNKGPLLTTTNSYPMPFDDLVLKSAGQYVDTSNWTFNQDFNSGNTIGTSYIQSTSGGGVRSSASTAYLRPALTRPNLDVLIGATVTKLSNVVTKGTPDLRDVSFVVSGPTPPTPPAGASSPPPPAPAHTIRARKEVILAAGAVNTPQLLLLSGVGNATELAAFKIPSVVDSPAVGKEMQDHPLLSVQWTTDSNKTLDALLSNTTAVAEIQKQWETNKTGLYSDVAANLFTWTRLAQNSTVIKKYGDPSAGPTSGHIELVLIDHFSSFTEPTPENGTYISMVTNVASPASRGSIKLASSDPLKFPLIDPGYFTNDYDVNAMVASLHLSEDFLATGPWAHMNLKRFGSWANATTDAELAAMTRARVSTFWHPCCTARMGKDNDKTSVVNSKLLVKGAKGVRVVDASVFPFIPAAHLQAPVYAIAERAADIIIAAYP